MKYKLLPGRVEKLVVAGTLFIAAILMNGSSQSTVTFNVNGAADTVYKEMFGVLMERLGRQWNGTGAIWVGTGSTIPNTNGMRTDIINGMRDCGVGAIQWPGGCAATGYVWSPPNPATDIGTDRFIQFCQLTGATPVICGPRDNASSNLAWVRHIDSQMTSRGMGLLQWFKDGNEVWGGCGSGINVNSYMPMFTRCYNSMNTYRPDLKLEACTDMEGNWAWVTTMINSIGSQIDGVEYHDYIFWPDDCPGDNPSNPWYWQIMCDVVSRDFGGHIRNNIIPALVAANPDARIKLIVDEWGDWLIDEGDAWMQQVILMDALSAAMHLHVMMPYAKRITVACLAQGVNVIHSLMNINTASPPVMVKTPVYYVFKMFIPHHTNNAKWCPITASSIQTTTQTTERNGSQTFPVVTVGATVDNRDTVNISFTNCDISATRQAVVTLTSSQLAYGVASAQVVTGTAINATNNFGAAESVNIQTLDAANYSIAGKILTVTLPARSVVMFRLRPLPGAIQPGSFLKNAADAFSIKAGPRGTVIISSSVSQKTPVTMSLYSVDGRTLIDKVSRTFQAGNSTCVLGNNLKGSGVYVVKIAGEEINLSKKVVVAR